MDNDDASQQTRFAAVVRSAQDEEQSAAAEATTAAQPSPRKSKRRSSARGAKKAQLSGALDALAEVSEDELRAHLRALDGNDVEAIVQVGTNLSTIALAASLEKELCKPVVAINTATYCHALRALGIAEQFDGFGRLFSEY